MMETTLQYQARMQRDCADKLVCPLQVNEVKRNLAKSLEMYYRMPIPAMITQGPHISQEWKRLPFPELFLTKAPFFSDFWQRENVTVACRSSFGFSWLLNSMVIWMIEDKTDGALDWPKIKIHDKDIWSCDKLAAINRRLSLSIILMSTPFFPTRFCIFSEFRNFPKQ